MARGDGYRSRSWRLALVLAMAALALVSWQQSGERPVEAAGSTPDLAMAIDVGGGGDDCDTRASTTGIGSTCTVAVGGMFTVRGIVDSIAGLVNLNGNGITGYVAFQFKFNFSSDLTLKNRANPGAIPGELGSPVYWPQCTDLESETKAAGSYSVSCFNDGALANDSTYETAPPGSVPEGKLVEVDFTCGSTLGQTVTMDDTATYVHNESHGNTPLDKEGDEVLTINCSAGVGGIAEAPEVAGMPLAEPDPSGTNIGLLAGVAAAAGGVVMVSGAAWYARRRWSR